jgi:hypothetical protein
MRRSRASSRVTLPTSMVMGLVSVATFSSKRKLIPEALLMAS